MKQVETHTANSIKVACRVSLKEKLRILFSKKFIITIDKNISSSDGVMRSYRNLTTSKKN